MQLKSIIIIILLCTILIQSANAQQYQPTWESLDARPMPEWFNQAKFGIFIHWGAYSVPAWRPLSSKLYASYAEWYYAKVYEDHQFGGHEFHVKNYGPDFEYRNFAPMFKAELFDPDQWADIFTRAGAKYVVLTSKHHDGFCLWPTASPYKKNYNSVTVGPKRDLVGDLTTAVRKRGLKMGLYYSLIEWESSRTARTETGYYISQKLVDKYQIPRDEYVDKHVLPQLKELVTNYQPALIFSDAGEWDESEEYWKTKEFLAWLYNQAPNKNQVVVNDRFAKGMPGKHGDYFSSEYADTDAVSAEHPWEESRGVGGSYGFNRAENLDDYSTSADLIHELIDIASRGGNLLLNVGPTADGRIPVIMQQRLIDIGSWLNVNGDAIYGSHAWRTNPNPKIQNTYFTTKGNDLYIITTHWPTDQLAINGLKKSDNTTVTMLGLDKPLNVNSAANYLIITPPIISPNQLPCQHAYTIKITNVLN
ncbi:MAG: alpha-L-fucosidase [Planctomycetes bacterium]|nr:alpha-L-fucosidase [Planctomycetota bacterium]